MTTAPVQPETTLAIVMGASRFPLCPSLPGGHQFEASARDFAVFMTANDGFRLPMVNLLYLFDTQESPNEIDFRIEEFLGTSKKNLDAHGTPARDLIVYYVGHGGFTSGDQQYFLAMRTTRERSEGISSIRMSDLAGTLKSSARELRRYLILDCCFAGSAFGEFQSGVAAATRSKTLAEFPNQGTSLLCASSSRNVALAPTGEGHTMFSGALLEVLHRGVPESDARLTLEEVGRNVAELIAAKHVDRAVRPEVGSPDQREGRIADIPLFPNLATSLRPSEEIRRDLNVVIPSENAPTALMTATGGSVSTERTALIATLASLLHGPDAGLARDARKVLVRLQHDPTSEVAAAARGVLGEIPNAADHPRTSPSPRSGGASTTRQPREADARSNVQPLAQAKKEVGTTATDQRGDLRIISGPSQPHSYAIGDHAVRIGKSPDCDVILTDPAASGHHARLERRGGQFVIIDLGSTNGTLVNSVPVQEHVLQDGDDIRIGQCAFIFSLSKSG